jgi:hypothetical protein
VATATRAGRNEYQAALEYAWAAIEAARWDDAARAYQRARELLWQTLKTERGETRGFGSRAQALERVSSRSSFQAA